MGIVPTEMELILEQTQQVFDGAFGEVREEEVVVGEGMVVTSSSLEMLTNSYLEGIMVCLIFLEGLEKEALVEFMVELFEEDDKKRLSQFHELELDILEHQFLPPDGCDGLDLLDQFE
nr:hypothetical protein [Tanacetum cinerariifolium]